MPVASSDKDMANPPTSRTAPKSRLAAVLSLSVATLATGAKAQANSDSASTEPSPADASSSETGPEPTKEQCIDWHRLSQLAQNDAKLLEARGLAQRCTALTCPGLIVNDCARWINDLDQRLPSVVFEVRVDGEPDLTATVTSDGKSVDEWTRGESLRLDPGEHEFHFELGKYPPITRKVLLAEGMRFRVISVEFKSSDLPGASALPAPTPTPSDSDALGQRRLPKLFYPLVGVGAGGITGFVVFALIGKSKQSNLEDTCKPNCTDSDLGSMKTAYLIGDISLGIGVASLVTAGILYFGAERKATTTTVGVSRLPGGGVATATYRF